MVQTLNEILPSNEDSNNENMSFQKFLFVGSLMLYRRILLSY